MVKYVIVLFLLYYKLTLIIVDPYEEVKAIFFFLNKQTNKQNIKAK